MIIELTPNNDTQQVDKAIRQIEEMGGGILRLLPGTHLSGAVTLCSNLTLDICSGATLKAVADLEAFPKRQSQVPSRMDVVPWRSFIFGQGLSNVVLCGAGTIDGSGDELCFQDGIDNSPNRPYGLFLVNCEYIHVSSLKLRSSAFWMQRYLQCRNLKITDLDIFNHCNKNNDGVDIDSCTNVLVNNCKIDSSDDALCIKSEGLGAASNIVCSNLILSSHATAIKLGTGSIGGFENIQISNVLICKSSSTEMKHPFALWGGLCGIELATVDGGKMHNIQLHNIQIIGPECPIHIRKGNRLSGSVTTNYDLDGKIEQGVTNGSVALDITNSPVLGNIQISNIQASELGPYPIIISGSPNYPIANVTLRDIHLQKKETDEVVNNDGEGLTESDFNDEGYPMPRMYTNTLPAHGLFVREVRNLVVENLKSIPSKNDNRNEIYYFDNP